MEKFRKEPRNIRLPYSEEDLTKLCRFAIAANEPTLPNGIVFTSYFNADKLSEVILPLSIWLGGRDVALKCSIWDMVGIFGATKCLEIIKHTPFSSYISPYNFFQCLDKVKHTKASAYVLSQYLLKGATNGDTKLAQLPVNDVELGDLFPELFHQLNLLDPLWYKLLPCGQVPTQKHTIVVLKCIYLCSYQGAEALKTLSVYLSKNNFLNQNFQPTNYNPETIITTLIVEAIKHNIMFTHSGYSEYVQQKYQEIVKQLQSKLIHQDSVVSSEIKLG